MFLFKITTHLFNKVPFANFRYDPGQHRAGEPSVHGGKTIVIHWYQFHSVYFLFKLSPITRYYSHTFWLYLYIIVYRLVSVYWHVYQTVDTLRVVRPYEERFSASNRAWPQQWNNEWFSKKFYPFYTERLLHLTKTMRRSWLFVHHPELG